MKALIVDDQSYVADGIYAGVNWEKLGIDKVYVAYSGSQAMQYIKNNQIDLVITDIEMPVISGVELAAWIVDYRPETAVIFLTAHADFSYAQQAVRLGCYDSIVQPVEYRKLELSIARVKAELEKKNSREDLYDDGLKWNSMKKEMQESFWNKVLLRKPHMNLIQIEQESQKIDLELDWQERYCLILVQVLNQKESLSSWSRISHTDELVESVVKEVLAGSLEIIFQVRIDENAVCYLIQGEGEIENCCKKFWEEARMTARSETAVYFSEYGEVEELADFFDRQIEKMRQNVAFYTGVFPDGETVKEETEKQAESFPDTEQWVRYLKVHEEEKVWQELHSFMERKKKEAAVTRELLAAMQQILLHAVYNALRSSGTSLQSFISSQESQQFYAKMPHSLNQFYQMAEQLLEQCKKEGLEVEEEPEVDTIQQIKEYIQRNIEKELSRQEIADAVFMSKDYVSHIFKKSEGINLIDYINSEKMKRARMLLETTTIPVNLVALKVGMPNYAYFSKLFKKSTGMSATEYREKNS